MKAFVLRLNPDTRSNGRYSKYPTKAEYSAIHQGAPMDGFHEAINFLAEDGVVRGYLPPKHLLAMQTPEPFALVTITAKTAKIGGDHIVGFQVGCLHQGENNRVNVPRESQSLKLVWHFACPATLSFALPEPIPNARELVVGAGSKWLRGPTHAISIPRFTKVLKLAQEFLSGTSDRHSLDALLEATKSKANASPFIGQSGTDFEDEVDKAMQLPLDGLAGTAHPKQILVSSFQFVRDPKVVAYALKKAKGICGDCGQPAPFKSRRTGRPFLEVHHKQTLANSGADRTDNVIALCPNCHRKRHHG